MGAASCDLCQRPITSGPISCSSCAVDNARAHAEAETDRLRAAVRAFLYWDPPKEKAWRNPYELAEKRKRLEELCPAVPVRCEAEEKK